MNKLTPSSAILRRENPAIAAWTSIGFLAALTASLIGSHAGAVLNIAFTPAAVAVGIILYLYYPAHFLGFAIWLWMLVPLVRRLADWQSEHHVISPIIVAPVLVTAISVFSAWRSLPRVSNGLFSPYFAMFGVILWAYLVGVLNAGFAAPTYSLLNYSAPLFFAIHILNDVRFRDRNAEVVFSAFAWGTLVTGTYGVWQYFDPQIWDRIWMETSELVSIGSPLPQKVRVFSTMNSPAVFGMYMMAGLLIILTVQSKIRWLAAAPGFGAFMLSLVRSAWGGFAVGAIVLLAVASVRNKIRYVIITSILLALAVPLLTYGPVAQTIQARLETLSDTSADTSFRDRLRLYENFLDYFSVIGNGLGTTGLSSRLTTNTGDLGKYGTFDSGIIDAFVTFGLFAPIIFIILIWMFVPAIYAARRNSNAMIAAAIASATASNMIFTQTISGAPGMLLFPFLAIAAVYIRPVPSWPMPGYATGRFSGQKKRQVHADLQSRR